MKPRLSSEESHVLMHATTSGKAKSIQMKGFQIGPKTVRATGYCKKGDYDCLRAESYIRSEEVLEKVRRRIAPELPSRQQAIFFTPIEGSQYQEGGGIFKVGEDEWGKPTYDFGFGKDALFAVDARRIPCTCGIGDGAKSDEVFAIFNSKHSPYKDIRQEHAKKNPEAEAERFWEEVEKFDPRTYEPYSSETEAEPTMEIPEVWCPCKIPTSAIIEKFDKNNPLPD